MGTSALASWLVMYSWRVTAYGPEAEATQVVLSLAAGTVSEEAFAACIRDNTVRSYG